MKNRIWPVFLFLSVFAFLSCEKEQDVSVLQGEWKSTEITFQLTPEDPEVRSAIAREINRLCDYFVVQFDEAHECREYRYKNGTQASMFTGSYFYNNGYKMRFRTSDFLGRTVVHLDLHTADSMTGRFNVTRVFQDPSYLEQIGASDPKNHFIEKVEIMVSYRRTTSTDWEEKTPFP